MTDIVWDSWVLPHRNSPKTSLMLMVWKPLRNISRKNTVLSSIISPAQDSIELLAACRDLQHPLSLMTKLVCSLEATS